MAALNGTEITHEKLLTIKSDAQSVADLLSGICDILGADPESSSATLLATMTAAQSMAQKAGFLNDRCIRRLGGIPARGSLEEWCELAQGPESGSGADASGADHA